MHGKVIKLPMRFLTESFLEQAETCLKDPFALRSRRAAGALLLDG
jgi:hypothetical protein